MDSFLSCREAAGALCDACVDRGDEFSALNKVYNFFFGWRGG